MNRTISVNINVFKTLCNVIVFIINHLEMK